MDNTELITTTCATLAGAVLGAFLGFLWQRKTDKRKDKQVILATLMAYRGVGASEPDWVKALNMIDIVFYNNSKVRNLRREYFKHLWRPLYETGAHHRILLDLIYEMAIDIGYTDLKQTDITDYYFPEGFGKLYGAAAETDSPSAPSPS